MDKYGSCGCKLALADGNGDGIKLRVKAVDDADRPLVGNEVFCKSCAGNYRLNGMVLDNMQAETRYLAS